MSWVTEDEKRLQKRIREEHVKASCAPLFIQQEKIQIEPPITKSPEAKNLDADKKERREKKETNRNLYDHYLSSANWNQKREILLDRDGYRCRYFGCRETLRAALHAHHRTYVRVFDEDPDDLITLCSVHHKEAHSRCIEVRSVWKAALEISELPRWTPAGEWKERTPGPKSARPCERFTKAMTALSVAKDFNKAAAEWEVVGTREACPQVTCICGNAIKHVAILQNTQNGNEAEIGSTCLGKFINGIQPTTSKETHMAKPVTIGAHEFATQKAAQEHCREIIKRLWAQKVKVRRHGVADTRFVPIRTIEDREFIKALFLRHPGGRKKMDMLGEKITGFAIGLEPEHHKPSLFVSIDGHPLAESFGFLVAIKGEYPKSKRPKPEPTEPTIDTEDAWTEDEGDE